MQLAQSFIPELQHEAANTRKILEKVPFGDAQWKPHEKSMAIGRLATHVAELPGWITMTLTTDELNFSTMEYKPKFASNAGELLQMFDENVQKAVETLQNASNETMQGNWTLRNGDHIILSMPRAAVIRSMAMNHLIHHRAQLGVYLRLQNIALPGMYGPSADEM